MRGIRVEEQSSIAYGEQLRLSSLGEKATLNLYWSARKGISFVIGAKPGSGIKAILETIRDQTELDLQYQAPELAKHDWRLWIGSDECGKGDYFGPLVVCAFKASNEQTAELRALGVRDSKQLRDNQIIQIATSLYQQFPGRMSGIVLKPARYNQIMDDMKSNSRNLNDLLAWQHCGVIQNLLDASQPVDGILVDQFSKSKKVAAAFRTKQPDLRVVERSGAESDLAVAAASILARYQFLGAMKELSKRYKIDLPLGAGSNVDKAAREFVKLHGLDRLNEVAKLHFKNTLRVQATPTP